VTVRGGCHAISVHSRQDALMRIDPPALAATTTDPGTAMTAPDAVATRIRPSQLWLVLLLMLAVILAFADRSLLAILIDPIKTDFRINDVQASLLMGLAFSVVYTLAALPLGALTDRIDRRMLIAAAIITWSVMTIYCGFARNFGQLFFGRMGLGIAEAALGPAAFSLMRDSFAPSQRGRAFAVFQASHLLGTGGALLIGGSLLGMATAGNFTGVPIVGAFKPWQQVLVALGAVGIPVGLLTLTMREPARQGLAGTKKKRPGFKEALRFVGQHKNVFLPFWAGIALFAMAQGGLTAWTAMTVHRTWNVPIPVVGATLGPIQVTIALIGSFTMGTIVDMATKRGIHDAPLSVAAVSLALAALAALAQLFLPSVTGAMVAYVVMLFFFAASAIASSAGLALIAPPALAGKLQAISGIAINLLGLATGATVVALVSSHGFSGPNALHHGLAIVVAGDFMLGVLMFSLVSRALRRRHRNALPDLASLFVAE
jgi:MFS family permease